MSASETKPSSSAVKLVSPASTFGAAAMSFSQGVPPSTEIPRRVGSWDTATSKAMPLR